MSSPPDALSRLSRMTTPLGAAAIDDALGRVVRERDELRLLHEALADVERATTLEERLRVFVQAIQRIGFGRVVITLRDADLNATATVTAGLSEDEDRDLRANAVHGEVWRRRLDSMERFRISNSYYLDSRDAWVAEEFGNALPSHQEEVAAPGRWNARDFLLVPLRGAAGGVIATLVLDDPTDGAVPTLARVRTVELFAQQVATIIDYARLVDVAERRAARVQRLQEAGQALAATLDEREIVRELARQAERLVPCDGLAIVAADERGTFRPEVRREGGKETELKVGGHCDALVAETLTAHGPVRRDTTKRVEEGGVVRETAGTLIGVPAYSGGEVVAVIAAWSHDAGAFPPDDVDALVTIGAHAGTALSNARLYAESMRERRRSESLADVARAVSASLRMAEVGPLLLRHAVALLRSEGAVLALLRDDALTAIAAVGAGEPLLGETVPMHASIAGRAIREQRAIITNDASTNPDGYARTRDKAGVRQILTVPLITSQGPLGVIAAINRAVDFNDDDANTMQRLADQVAAAIVNARLFEEHHSLGERYRRVLETTSDAILITDAGDRITFTNPAADNLLGLKAPPIGQTVMAFIAPELRAAATEHGQLVNGGSSQHFGTVLVRGDGERRTVSASMAPLRDGSIVVGVVHSWRDVTDERRARDAVAQSEARYRNLFESATDAIYTLDAHACFTSVNAATCRMAGMSREELLGRSAMPLLATGDVARAKEHFKSALAGSARHYESTFVRGDGTRRLASVTNTPIRHGSQVVGVLGIARDVTEERERALALQRSEARYTRLVESASDAIFTVGPDGLLTSVNKSLERAVGQARSAMLGTPFVSLIDARDTAAATLLLEETLAGERKRADLRYLGAGDEIRSCSLMTTPIFEDGRITGALGIVRDVTDEKRLAEQLMQQEKLAAVGQLVSGVAHELNNPLAGVMAFSQLLLAAPASDGGTLPPLPDQRRAIEAIHQEAKRAAKIVSNLLTFARQHTPERTLADLNRVVTDTVELRRYALRVQQVEVDLHLDPMLPLTWADPFQLQQVVLNLVTNAEQALGDWAGDRRIAITTAHRDGMLEIQVRDTGPGIAPDHLPRVFNPFFTTKPVGQGTGLGLSISDGIVREHGGRIRVESRQGQGATFTLEVPHVVPPAPTVLTPVDATPAVAERHRFLIVDDEPAIRSAITTYLKSLGHEVDQASSGREALAMAARHDYDGIVLDLRMPAMAGDMVYEQLQITAPGLAERVVFLTGDLQNESARRFLETSGRPIVHKPFLLDELGAVLLAQIPH